MSRSKTDFWVGLFVLLGAAALVFLALRAGNLSTLSFAPTYTLTANFNNVGGLKAGAPVKSAGVTIGRVANIGFDNQLFQAVVTINVDQDRNFPTDSSISILTSGLLGEQYLGIDPGGEDKNFSNGDKIQYTQSAVVLENLISQFLYSSADRQGSSEDGAGGAGSEGGASAGGHGGASAGGVSTSAPRESGSIAPAAGQSKPAQQREGASGQVTPAAGNGAANGAGNGSQAGDTPAKPSEATGNGADASPAPAPTTPQ